MSYIVKFTDSQNKLPITVFDNTSSTDTSLSFPGRNVTGYGQIIAENFLHLLENFASASAPLNPVEGQLWYDTAESTLKVWDNINWKAASNIQTSPVDPPVEEARVGELWVDTINQQLYVFSGSNWILIGPEFSTGLRTGPKVEAIDDTDNIKRVVLIFYVEDTPLIIFSKDSFTPKIPIDGFLTIKSGLTITSINFGTEFFGTKINGTAQAAESLIISDAEVPASRFLRTDVPNTTDFRFNIRNNSGLTIGADGSFNLTSTPTSARIFNSNPGSSIDIQTNRDGSASTTLRVIDNRVGINKLAPAEALDVDGNITTNGSLILTNSSSSINLNTGSFRTEGGIAIKKNVLIGDGLDVTGTTNTQNIIPKATDLYELGTISRRWNVVRTKTLVAQEIQGIFNGNLFGNATTATNLKTATTFTLEGDVTSAPLQFDGAVGGFNKTFSTTITAGVISSKPEPSPNRSQSADTILVFRPGQGLIKQTRTAYLADLAVPIGAILPYAGNQAPPGFLLCDGSEVERTRYGDLFDTIGTTYNGPAALSGFNTFRLPDLRGRFPLGRDNMDNGTIVPTGFGGFVDAGGGNIDRVPGTEADTVGGSSGQSTTIIGVNNLPNHEHNMIGTEGQQYYAIRSDTSIPADSGAILDRGPTVANQAQLLPSSGFIKTEGALGQPFNVMNPFITLNYIIRSGFPAF